MQFTELILSVDVQAVIVMDGMYFRAIGCVWKWRTVLFWAYLICMQPAVRFNAIKPPTQSFHVLNHCSYREFNVKSGSMCECIHLGIMEQVWADF